MKLKERMGPKGIAIVKICLWAGVLTWSIFWLALGIVMSQAVQGLMLKWGRGLLGRVLVWVAPIWVIFTVLLTIVYVMRWVGKKLGPKDG